MMSMVGINYRTILSRLIKLIGLSAGLAALLVVVNSTSSFATERTWTDIGHLGYSKTSARAMNDHGVVVGDSWVTGREYHAFVWQDGQLTDIGTSGENSTALDINNQGQVIGYRYPPDEESKVFIWQDGVMQDLPLDDASVRDINDHGQIVGSIANEGRRMPYVYDITTDTLTLLGSQGYAEGINNNGQIVGSRLVEGYSRATLWSDGETIDLGTVSGYPHSVATQINNNGNIIGWLADEYNWTQRAFYWHNGVMQEIGPGDLGTWNVPNGINDHDQVFGSHYEADGDYVTPLLWQNNESELIENDELHFGYGVDINNTGQLVVNGAYGATYVSSATVSSQPVTIDDIIATVNQLFDNSELSYADTRLLTALLEKAKDKIEKPPATCRILTMTIDEIMQMNQEGKISTPATDTLISDIQKVRQSISCSTI